MSVVWMWSRIDAARRWRSLTVLALLIAVAGGTVLTAVAGARRGESALERLAARSLPATVEVVPLSPDFDWSLVLALPEVEVTSRYVDTDFRVEGVPPEDLSIGHPSLDTELMRTIERPIVLQGRLADPNRADEAVVTRSFVTTYGKGVGDTVTATLPSPEEAQRTQEIGASEPSGPRVPIRIVGVVRSPWFTDGPMSHGTLIPTPALWRTYQKNLHNDYTWSNALIRLKGGEAAVPAFKEHLAAVTGRSDVLVDDRAEVLRRRQRATAFEARWLLAFGAAAFLAAVVLIGQALTRHVTASLADLPTLRALGMARNQAVLAALAAPLGAATAGACGGAVIAVVASRWFPIGSGANSEPAPGYDVDWPVLGTGVVVIVLLVLAGAAASAWLAAGTLLPSAERRSSVAAAAAAAHLPVPVVVGTRFALEPGRGPAAVPVRPALFGAIAGVLGVVAALTFSAGVTEAAGNPARFGQTWHLEAWMGFDGQDFVPPGLLQAAARDPDVAAVNDWRAAIATETRDRRPLIVYTFSRVGRPITTVLAAGRLPNSASEAVLAPGSADALDAGVGDTVTIAGTTGAPRNLTVSGIGFVPAGSHCPDCTNAEGAWVSDGGFDALFQAFHFHGGFVAVRPGARVEDVAARLQRLAPPTGGPNLFAPPYPPSAVSDLRRVQPFPLALGAFLALLAAAAVGHSAASVVRRRRHDVAVLRALGMTPRQSRAVILTQGSVPAVVGLLFGVPLGVAAGRTLWRVVADYTPLQYVPPVALWALFLVGPLTLLVAGLLAAWPGHQAARLRVGHVLRAE
jgi:ABC-type lipoprotein release transport system permease subunit